MAMAAIQQHLSRARPRALARFLLLRFSHSETEPSLGPLVVDNQKKQRPQSALNRIAQRIQVVYDRIQSKRLPPEARGTTQNAVKSEMDVINVVEQRVWHSILEGDFEKLPGKGKPLEMQGNPHADPADELLYRILAKNGFAPEWVELNKEIRFRVERWRRALQSAWKRKMDPLNGDQSRTEIVWKAELTMLEAELKDINQKMTYLLFGLQVLHYNLIVPFGRQVFSYKLEKEIHELQQGEQ